MTDLPVPLIATSDERLVDDALRWCAAVGASPQVARDPVAARRGWRAASAVLVGGDLAAELAASSLPRREHVIVVAPEPAGSWEHAVALGAAAVCGSRDDERIVDLLAAALDGGGEACVVSVLGGVGGAGASTLTVALGLAAARRGMRPLVMDADPMGGGLDLVLGAERADGLRWDEFAATRGRIDAGSLTSVLPVRTGLSALTWRPGSARGLPESWPGVLSAAVRGFDLVAVDLARHLDGAAAEIAGRSVLTLVLVPEEIAAVAAARHVLAVLRRSAPAIGVIGVERRGGIGVAAVEEGLEMPVIARLRPDRRVRGAIDRGHGPGASRSLRRTSARVLDALGLERP